MKLLGISALLVGAVLLNGCKKDDGPSVAVLTPTEQVALGWEYFVGGDYTGSLSEFTLALGRDATLSDAMNGIGWSIGRIPGRLSEAPQWFARALARDTTRYDALGGWAFAAYQLGDWQSAIHKSDSLLHRRPGWRFLHESTVDQNDIILMQAAAYYNLGDFATSLVSVTSLNAAFEADVSTPAGRRELFDEIERLRRVYG